MHFPLDLKDDAWDHSEDGVSFWTQSTATYQQTPIKVMKTPIKVVKADSLNQVSPSAVVASRSQSREVGPVAPFAIKRRAQDDLRCESSTQALAPPLEDYLEIKKYAGVQWADLPPCIQARRLIVWGDIEAPEAVKRRKIEEKEKMRTREKLAKEQEMSEVDGEVEFQFDFGEDDSDMETEPFVLDDFDDAPMSPFSW